VHTRGASTIGTTIADGRFAKCHAPVRYLVKDRMERSGMRWTLEGARSMLNLRAVFQSHRWSKFLKQNMCEAWGHAQSDVSVVVLTMRRGLRDSSVNVPRLAPLSKIPLAILALSRRKDRSLLTNERPPYQFVRPPATTLLSMSEKILPSFLSTINKNGVIFADEQMNIPVDC